MALTDTKIRQARASDKPFKLTDSNGLYLEVKPNGSKLWRYRYRIDGSENVFAIGKYPDVSLLDARKLRDTAREKVKLGINPSHARKTERSKQLGKNANTFEAIATEWMEKRKSHITPYYHSQIERGLKNDIFPKIGKLPIETIDSKMVLEVLDVVSKRGAPVVAMNLRQYMSAVFCYAIVTQRAVNDPTFAIRGAIIRPTVTNAEPMNAAQIKDFLQRVDVYGGAMTTKIGMKMLAYTFVRTIEMRRAVWSEVDLDAAMWTIPGDKMKMGRTHMVPLSRQVVEMLKELKKVTGGGNLLFPSTRRPSEMMSATTVNRALEYLGVPFTGHDFRATASTHLYEAGYPEHLVEMQLAHAETNKTKAAYNHAKYLPERREMMQHWADYLDGIQKSP